MEDESKFKKEIRESSIQLYKCHILSMIHTNATGDGRREHNMESSVQLQNWRY
jgi:hypothetical protein